MHRNPLFPLVCLLATAAAGAAVDRDASFFGSIWKGRPDALFGPLFTQVTPENAGKWGQVEATRGSFTWSSLDAMFRDAASKGLITKQHTFVWGQAQPSWVTSGNAQVAVTAWMTAFMNRYGDQVHLIDVVNEPLHAAPSYRSGLGGDGATGWDWVIWCYQLARQKAPNARLLINDYDILSSDSATERYVALCRLLRDRGLLDGIGEQAHNFERTSLTTLRANLDRLATLGLPIYISEFDLSISDDQAHLARFRDLFTMFWEHPGVRGVTVWGHRQGATWRSNAHLVRSDGSDRPALTWLRQYLASHPKPGPVTNRAPVANAGADRSLTLPANLALTGSATDDGLPAGSALTYAWSRVSGPGTVAFAPANAATTTASFTAPGTYVLRLTASDGQLSDGDDVTVTVIAAPASAVAINFQPAAAPTQAGWTPDTGAVFATRNGLSYGWSVDVTGTARDRNSAASPDQVHDTLVHLQKQGSATWRLQVANGTYQVRLIAGDANHIDSVYRTTVEGVLVLDATPSPSARWHEAEATVTVTDGMLDVASGAGAVNNKLCAIEVVPMPVGGG